MISFLFPDLPYQKAGTIKVKKKVIWSVDIPVAKHQTRPGRIRTGTSMLLPRYPRWSMRRGSHPQALSDIPALGPGRV